MIFIFLISYGCTSRISESIRLQGIIVVLYQPFFSCKSWFVPTILIFVTFIFFVYGLCGKLWYAPSKVLAHSDRKSNWEGNLRVLFTCWCRFNGFQRISKGELLSWNIGLRVGLKQPGSRLLLHKAKIIQGKDKERRWQIGILLCGPPVFWCKNMNAWFKGEG